MDISEERLDMIHKLATRYADELGVDLTFENSTDRKEALQDADFVLNTAYMGGRPLVCVQEQVSDKHGSYGPITPRTIKGAHYLLCLLSYALALSAISVKRN